MTSSPQQTPLGLPETITGFISSYKGARSKSIWARDDIPPKILALHKKLYLNLEPEETPLLLLHGSWLFGFMVSGLAITDVAIHYRPSSKVNGKSLFRDTKSLEIGNPKLDARGNYVGHEVNINDITVGFVRMGTGISFDKTAVTLLNCLFNSLVTGGFLEKPVSLSLRLLDEKATVRARPRLTAPIVAELQNGEEALFEKTAKSDGALWLFVTLLDGRQGYLPGDVKTTLRYTVSLAQDSVDILESPASGAGVKMTARRTDTFSMIGAVAQGDTKWIKIRTASGHEGFVPGETLYLRNGSREAESLWGSVIFHTAEAFRPAESKGIARACILPGALLGYCLGKFINNHYLLTIGEMTLAGAVVGWLVGQAIAFVRNRG